MSKGIVIGRWRVKPRFVFFVFAVFMSVFLLVKYYSRPPIPYVVEAGSMHLEYGSEAILVRDEEAYNAPEYGRVTYYADEEDLIDRGELVATIFKANYQEDMVYQLYNVQEKIINYQQENILKNITDHDIKNVQSKVDALIHEMQTHVKNGALDKLTKSEKEFRNLLEQRQRLVDKKTVPDSYLKKLNEEEAQISEQLKEWKIDITAPKSGLVSYYIDNLETVLTFDALEKINLNIYKDLINWKISDDWEEKDEEARVDSPFFRIIDPEKWYIVCEIKYPKIFFEEGERISISFLDFEDKVLEGHIKQIEDEGNTFLLVVEFKEDIEDFINIRNTSVKISKSVDGLVIPKRAIVERKPEKGVFKLKNDETIFIGVEIIAESPQEDYIIINEESSLIEEGDVIKLN